VVYFEKSQPAPKIGSTYNSKEVINRVEKDFHNKCYICEEKEPKDINIEHFIAHQGDDRLRLDWNNLFLSCAHCNNVKLDKYNNLLNCTDIDDRVDLAIHYYCNPMPKERAVFKVLIASQKATQTVELLNRCYNGEHTAQKRLESSNLRVKLIKEIRVFQELIFEYEDFESDITLEKIKFHLSNKSPFTAFKRWIIRDSEYLNNRYGEYIIY
jgi:uncharacterized protein (TIGR02646 family)